MAAGPKLKVDWDHRRKQCDSNKTYLQGWKHSDLLPSRLDIHSVRFKEEKSMKYYLRKRMCINLYAPPISKSANFLKAIKLRFSLCTK